MKNILVTGGLGLIGHNVVNRMKSPVNSACKPILADSNNVILQKQSMLIPRSRDMLMHRTATANSEPNVSMRKSATVTAHHNLEQPAKHIGTYWPQCRRPSAEPRKQCLQTDICRQ